MSILPQSLVSGITPICFTHGMEEAMAGMALNKGIKLCGQRAFPLLCLREIGVLQTTNPSGKNVRMPELRDVGGRGGHCTLPLLPRHPKPVSAARNASSCQGLVTTQVSQPSSCPATCTHFFLSSWISAALLVPCPCCVPSSPVLPVPAPPCCSTSGSLCFPAA
ncbi:hypothetical protein RLOC_00011351 [Lonchura striata]|uniref:Uncharacterized protein n=1 Tax=Lonchura striata TaxID=40157 RepID=A0A218UFB4_9PASE|nr:hypothetical protein RLOC_00011351 [Lonchura striata domestica]